MQRCLVKAIALHGLGLYIYAGEDVPDGEKAANSTSVPVSEWDSLTTDEQTWLQDIAENVRRELQSKGGAAAVALIEEQGLEAKTQIQGRDWTRHIGRAGRCGTGW